MPNVMWGARVCLLPMAENDHRPLVLRHRSLSAISALLIVAKVLAVTIISLTPASAELSTITTARIIQLTNQQRQKAGLPALSSNSLLHNAAAQKAQDMLTHDYFAHISPTGVTPWFWMKKVNYRYQVAGENLAIDFTQAEDVVAAWLASPSHRDNMLHADYTETGVAVATGEFQGGTSIVVVHMFGLPTKPVATPTTAPPATTPPTPAVKATTTIRPPTPTPIPSLAPTPPIASPFISSPPLPSPDTIPPRVPRIATQTKLTSQDTLTITVSGESGSAVHFLLNDQAIEPSLALTSDNAPHTFSLQGIADGAIKMQAFAIDGANNRSELSEVVTIQKDTARPLLAREQTTFLLSPLTDRPQVFGQVQLEPNTQLSVISNDETNTWLAGSTVTIALTSSPARALVTDSAGNVSEAIELTLLPQFQTDSDLTSHVPPARFSMLTRRLAAAIGTTLLILLTLAVVIKIRIQHPALIAHTSLVLVLAFIFFLI